MPLVITLNITSLPSFIWVRRRDRRPGFLLNITKPEHLGCSHCYSRPCVFSYLWVPKISFSSSPPEARGQKKIDKEEDVQLWMNIVITWSMETHECQLSCHKGLGKKWLNTAIPMKSIDCLDHLHHHLQLTFSLFGGFLSGLTMFLL